MYGMYGCIQAGGDKQCMVGMAAYRQEVINNVWYVWLSTGRW